MNRLYKNWRIHNLIAHPIMQILNDIGMKKLAIKIHDATNPDNGEKHDIS